MRRPHFVLSAGALVVVWATAIVHGFLGQGPSIAFGLVGVVAIFAIANWTSSRPAGPGRFVLLMALLLATMGAMVGVATLADHMSWPTWLGIVAIGIITAAGGSLAFRFGKDAPLGR